MLIVQDYKLLDKIQESNDVLIYRAERNKDQLPVMIKLLANTDDKTAREIDKFKHEYELIKDLDINGIIKPYSLEKFENELAIVFEDFGGISLSDYLKGSHLPVGDFLRIAIQLSEILDGIHKKNIIHKDIKPANIIISPETKEVRIIDFSISRKVQPEAGNTEESHNVEGTLSYISPEQTGRINKRTDFRSDLYSLGVTFYELLTGKLPFDPVDPLEIIHSHIAKLPAAPYLTDKSIPEILSDIIMKLLSKNAEDRYQTSSGLREDLLKCLKGLTTEGIAPFKLGLEDVCDKFQMPQKVYGRENEISELITAFNSVKNGAASTIFISGYPGIGKSLLLNEFQEKIMHEKAYFISGKFEEFEENVPFSAIFQAVRNLIQRMLTEDFQQIESWKEQFLKVLGKNLKAFLELFPDFTMIVGKPQWLHEEETETEKNTGKLLELFFGVFSSKEYPVILALDDIQWTDTASVNFLEQLLNKAGTSYLLTIMTYRKNEIKENSPVALLLSRREELAVTSCLLDLKPVTEKDIIMMIKDTFRSRQEYAEALARAIYNKTYGNPFFINDFLKTINNEKLVRFDPEQRTWVWNLEKIESLQITDNVVDLMAGKIKKLPENTQKVLKIASCLGNKFDLRLLSVISDKPEASIIGDLWEAIQANMILPVISTYKFSLDNIGASTTLNQKTAGFSIAYKFQHSRVQNAAFSLLSKAEKVDVFYKIGRYHIEKTDIVKDEKIIFDVANQLNSSIHYCSQGRLELAGNRDEKYKISEIFLAAGKKASRAELYETASKYLLIGILLLPKDCWQERYELAAELFKSCAECDYLSENYDESDNCLNVLLENLKTGVEKAGIYNRKVILYTHLGKIREAIDCGLSGLRLLGLDTNPSAGRFSMKFQKYKVNRNFNSIHKSKISDFLNVDTSEEKKLLINELVNNLIFALYPGKKTSLQSLLLRSTAYFLNNGKTEQSAFTLLAYFSMVYSECGENELLVELSEYLMQNEPADITLNARINFLLGSEIVFWKYNLDKSINHLERSYKKALESRDMVTAGMALLNKTVQQFIKGVPFDELHKEIASVRTCLEKSRHFKLNMLKALQAAVFNLEGKSRGIHSFSSEIFNESQLVVELESSCDTETLAFYNLLKMMTLYLHGNYAGSLKSADAFLNIAGELHNQVWLAEFYFYYSLVLLALYPSAAQPDKKKYKERLLQNQQRFKQWVTNSQENFQSRYTLIEAGMAYFRENSKNWETMELYKQAVSLSKEVKCPHIQAIANELAGKFCLESGNEEKAKNFLNEARYYYLEWGAVAKARILEETYGKYFAQYSEKRDALNISKTNTTTKSSTSEALDLATIMKAANSISGEIRLAELLEKLMKIVIENAGAQKGFLILEKEGSLFIEAEGSVDRENVIVLHSEPVEVNQNLSASIVNYAVRSKKDTVLNDAANEGIFTNDPYVQRTRPKSLLCMPIIHQGEISGVLYLENNLSTGVFTRERLELLKLLSTQIAISIKNAYLYSNLRDATDSLKLSHLKLEEYNRTLESKVEARTLELKDKNSELEKMLVQVKEIQDKMVQQEKMASLGGLTAGIAHEIKNPLNFVNNFAQLTVELADEVKDILEEYREEPKEELFEEIDEILTDISQNARKINEHGKRADSIVKGMLLHSRGKEGEKETVDINSLLDEYISLAYHGLRAKDTSFNVTIIKDFDPSIGKITVVPQDLSRAFLNIVNNACYAANDKKKKIGETFEPKLTITSKNDANNIIISIKDNGPGISKELVSKVFNPFFTTKPTGEGTGLGLSLSYDIIVQQHQGDISINTEEGEFTEFIISLPRA